jgi:hypothetical protein
MHTSSLTTILALILVFGTGITIPVSISWFDHRTRTRALDVLRVYAERGEEPPPSVVQALTAVSGWAYRPQPGEKRSRTRGGWLAHVAANAVFVVGLSALAWWRYSTTGEAGPGVIVALLAALFFAASLAAQSVYAYHAPDR